MIRFKLKLITHNFSTLSGLLLGLLFVSQFNHAPDNTHSCNVTNQENPPETTKEPTRDNLVFVGIMTAAKFLDTRAVAVYETWGKSVPGKIAFFTSESSKTNSTIPIVPLKGVADVYPPQKKSFMMLKYMHDNYINDYEWFMRADDDLYVRTDRLKSFLRSVNSDKVHYLGQAGFGNKEEIGMLNLGSRDNYCMGGPGMIFSRNVLKLVVPHIKECLHNLYSMHEDVEIGRCIQKFSNVTCTWAYDMGQLFHHSSRGENAYNGNLRTTEILQAMTLHPLKKPERMYSMHNFFNGLQIKELSHKMVNLKREMNALSKLLLKSDIDKSLVSSSRNATKASLTSYIPTAREDILTWSMMDSTVYDASTNNPHYKMTGNHKTPVNDIFTDLLTHIQKFNKERGRIITFKKLMYGYYRLNPVQGFNFILDALLNYNRYEGHKISLRVRRHAYFQKSFLEPQVREVVTQPDVRVNIILPLAGRLATFRRFLNNFERVCLMTDQDVELYVIVFNTDDALYLDEVKNLVKTSNKVYNKQSINLDVVDGEFSRGAALHIGASHYKSESLLTFLDVDMMFDAQFLERVRRNTIINNSAYFPVVYSQYNPDNLPTGLKVSKLFQFDEDLGYWRMYGYGILSIYKSDYLKTSGFNNNIKGWGLEDVDFVKRVMAANVTVFRSADPGIVHVYHEPSCDPTISKSQYEMCVGTKLSTLGSVRTLSGILKSIS